MVHLGWYGLAPCGTTKNKYVIGDWITRKICKHSHHIYRQYSIQITTCNLQVIILNAVEKQHYIYILNFAHLLFKSVRWIIFFSLLSLLSYWKWIELISKSRMRRKIDIEIRTIIDFSNSMRFNWKQNEKLHKAIFRSFFFKVLIQIQSNIFFK